MSRKCEVKRKLIKASVYSSYKSNSGILSLKKGAYLVTRLIGHRDYVNDVVFPPMVA